MTPWFVREKAIYRAEVDLLEKRGFQRYEDDAGRVAFAGDVLTSTDKGNQRHRVAITYPNEFPFRAPTITPLEPDGKVRRLSMRHQMANGVLCLFEPTSGAEEAHLVTAADALRRAAQWFVAAERGVFPPELDSSAADLETHYQRAGDIFVGDLLDRVGLAANGRFIARRLQPGRKGELFFVTHAEGASGWLDDHELAKNVHIIGLDLDDAWWSKTVTPSALAGLQEDGADLLGRCFDLAFEPPPVRDVPSLARLLFPNAPEPLKALEASFAIERAQNARIIVALRFPPRPPETRRDWLFLSLQLREKPRERVAAPDMKVKGIVLGGDARVDWATVEIMSLRTHDLRRRELEVRNTGTVPQRTADLNVSVLGSGALGSGCSELLVKAGVRSLRIWDPSTLDAGNVIRHIAPLNYVGLKKVEATLFELLNVNPHVKLDGEPSRVHEWKMRGRAPPWDGGAFILSTIADDAEELAFNALAVEANATVFYLRGLRRGTAARLVRVRPGRDACLQCIGHYALAADPRWIKVPAAAGEVVAHECGQAVLAASAADLAVVAGLGVRHFLEDAAATEPREQNNFVWTTTGIDGVDELAKPFSMSSFVLPPHPDCSVCRARAITEVRITHDVYDGMVRLAREAGTVETGGILVGRRTGAVVDVVSASGPGPNAHRTPDRFVRDGPFCQAFLEAEANKHQGVDYVGEWHSHPGASSTPSPRDQTSLDEIAKDPNFLTDCPVSVIIGLPEDAPVDPGCTVHPSSGSGGAAKLEIV